jgi:multimeric flavodoxin WrbA
MKILAINATYRPKRTTTKLTLKAMEGAASLGADTEMVMLCESKIDYCKNCLKCYKDKTSEIGPCSLKDDIDEILEKIREADGIILASPVHNGFVTGRMTVFFERIVWRVIRSPGSSLGVMYGLESRLTDKPRAIIAISSAGGMPEKLRKHCDDGTPWMKVNAPLLFHGEWIGDMYAGARLTKLPQNEKDWSNIYYLRKLSQDQFEEAFNLGVKMGQAIKNGDLKPLTMDTLFGPLTSAFIKAYNSLAPFYKTVE